MIIKNLIKNFTMVIPDATKNGSNSQQSLDQTEWKIIQYPQVNPVEVGGFHLGLWKCLVILAGLTVAFRIFSMICLKLLVTKF